MPPRAEIDQWERLETYRQRYPIERELAPVLSLENSINRRRARASALTRRLHELEEQLSAVRTELGAVEAEIRGSLVTGALLIDEIIEQVRNEKGEGWSPKPVLGFRVWSIKDKRIIGNQLQWSTPTMASRCLREIPGEDLPHPVYRCGPPACGIYAVKRLDMFAPGVAGGIIHNSVVGIVELRGKVIEHEGGYRAHLATAVAVSANDGARRLMTTDPDAIEELFVDPTGTMAGGEPLALEETYQTRAFLESVFAEEEKWT